MPLSRRRIIFLFLVLAFIYYAVTLRSILLAIVSVALLIARYYYNRFFFKLAFSSESTDALTDTSVDFYSLGANVKTKYHENDYCIIRKDKSGSISGQEKLADGDFKYRVFKVNKSYKTNELWNVLAETFSPETVYGDLIQICNMMKFEYEEKVVQKSAPVSKPIEQKTEPDADSTIPVLKVSLEEDSKPQDELPPKYNNERKIDF